MGKLSSGDELVIINSGKPSALIINIPNGYFDEIIQAVRQAKAMIALNNMRRKATRTSYLTDEEIESVIADVRNLDKYSA